jgi:hypothetical protein
VPVDKMHVPADRLVQQLENPPSRMLFRYRAQHFCEVFDEIEDD